MEIALTAAMTHSADERFIQTRAFGERKRSMQCRPVEDDIDQYATCSWTGLRRLHHCPLPGSHSRRRRLSVLKHVVKIMGLLMKAGSGLLVMKSTTGTSCSVATLYSAYAAQCVLLIRRFGFKIQIPTWFLIFQSCKTAKTRRKFITIHNRWHRKGPVGPY